MIAFLNRIAAEGILLEMSEDRQLKLFARNKEVDRTLLAEIKARKAEIIAYFIETSNGQSQTQTPIPLAVEQEFYTASSAQKRMYFLHQLDEESLAYNMPQVRHFTSELKAERLQQAFVRLIDRHHILRTTFQLRKGEVYQKINPQTDFDLLEWSTEERSLEKLFTQFVQAFDLEKGPLLRAVLVHTADDGQYLFVDFHHIISDGLSQEIMLRELMQLYVGEDLPPLPLQYHDFAEWQASDAQQEVLAEQLAFWKKEFEAERTTLELPADFLRPRVQSFAGKTLAFSFDPLTTRQLRSLAKESECTLFVLHLSLFYCLLYKLSHQDDLVVGTPVAGRPHPDLENVVGLFVNTLAIRQEVIETESFLDFQKRVKTKVLTCLDYQSLPLEELLDQLKVARDTSRNPLFDVLFTYEDTQEIGDPNRGLEELSQLSIAKFDLSLMLVEGTKQLHGAFEFATDLFSEATVQRMVNYFHQMVQQILANPQMSLADIDILPPAERQIILHKFNDTEVEYPAGKTILDLYQDQVLHNATKTAIEFAGHTLSFWELDQYSDQLAAYLIQNYQVEANDLIGVQLDRSEWLLVVILGILKAGGAYVPIDVNHPEERVAYIKKDSQFKICIDQEEWAKIQLQCEENSYPVDLPKVHPEQAAYAIYTSGSTGQPKGVLNDHAGLYNRLLWMRDDLAISTAQVLIQKTPYTFDVSVWELLMPLITGSKLVFARPDGHKDPDYLRELIEAQQVEIIHFVPSMLAAFLATSQTGQCLSLRHVVCSGEALPVQRVLEFKQIFPHCRLHNLYGPTEAAIDVTTIDLTEEEVHRRGVSIGAPVANTQIYIVDKKLRLQPIGVAGELLIGGVQVAREYLNKPTLSAQKFIPNPFATGRAYRTGDLAKWLPNGQLAFIGRMDSQVKIRGNRIELGEIENQLTRLPGVQEAAVLVGGEAEDKFLVAYYVGTEEVTETALKRHLQEQVPDYMIPNFWVAMDNMPQTSSGKINRKALPAPQFKTEEDLVTPASQQERELRSIWSEILKLEPEVISVERKFMDLGGHSLKALALIHQIHKSFGVKLPLADVFNYPTIRQLSQRLTTYAQSTYEAIPRAPIQDYYPLSSAQQRMYVLHQLDPASLAYNMPQLFRFAADLDPHRLTKAFGQLVARHEALRTTFTMVDHQPVQSIAETMNIQLDHHQGLLAALEEHYTQFVQAFDLEKGPLLRATLYHTEVGPYYLLLDMHHIIGDGLSFNLLYQDLLALYEGESLATPKIQYKDYAVWQQEQGEATAMAAHQAYWLEEFSQAPELLNLPLDYPRPASKSFAGEVLHFSFGTELTQGLKALAKEHGASLQHALLAIFQIFLYRLSPQKEIVVGIPSAGRDHEDLQPLIGLFVNTLAIKSELTGEEPFSDFLQKVRSKVLTAFDHQSYPYDDLVDQLKIPRDTSRNPLYDVLFTYDDFSEITVGEEGMATIEAPIAAKFDLNLQAYETGGQLKLSLIYSTDLFQATSIEGFRDYLQTLAEEALAKPNQAIGRMNLLSPAERQKVWIDFNQTQWDFPQQKSIVDLFEEQVEQAVDNIALELQDEKWSYGQLNNKANQLARFLRSRGLGEEDVIGIMLDRSPMMIQSILAVLKIGATYLPLDAEQPTRRIQHVLGESNASFLIYTQDKGEAYETQITGAAIEEIPLGDFKVDNLKSKVNPSTKAYILYTSGSTGQPKGVQITHRSVVNYITYQSAYFGITADENILQFSPYYFDASVEQIWLALVTGARLVLLDKNTLNNVDALVDYLEAKAITHLHATPSFLESLPARDGLSLRRVISGGEACKASLIHHFGEEVKFYNKYGPTESTVSAIEGLVEEDLIRGGKVLLGKPIGNTQVYILNEQLEPQAIGVPGEIFIAGEGLTEGYLNQPGLTAERFITHPSDPNLLLYRSGDVASWHADGNIEFFGRIDDQVKLRGYRIELGEIENQLATHPGVEEVAVRLWDNAGSQYLVAYYVAESLEEKALAAYLSARVPEYMLPTFWMKLTALPFTRNGKLDRRALPAPALETMEVYEKPGNAIETELQKLWSEVLDRATEDIGVQANFFELGGHSLKAIQLVSRIKQSFEVELPLTEIFNHPSIRQLGQQISEKEKSVYSAIPPAPVQDYYPLSSAQQRMYVLHQLDPTSLAYNMPQLFRFDAQLNPTRLTQAFRQLVARHEVLRTTFSLIDHEPMQKLMETTDIDLHHHQGTLADLEEHYTRFVQAFDLEQGPLLRAELYQTQTGPYYLLLDMHHIIGDGLSLNLLYQDLLTLYEGQTLAPPLIQYKDYAVWQQAQGEGTAMAAHRAFWLAEFDKAPELLDLPIDFPRPATKSHAGALLNFSFDPVLTKGLKALAKGHGASLQQLLLAIFQVFLYRLSPQKEIVVGIPSTGRDHEDLQEVVGLFVNTLAIKSELNGTESFSSLLQEVRNKVLTAFTHQSYPYDDLVDQLQLPRDTGRNPLYDVLFAYDNFSTIEVGGEREATIARPIAAKFDLNLQAYEAGDRLELSLVYSTDLFKPASIERFRDYLKNLAAAAIANPDQAIGRMQLLSSAEQQKVWTDFNQTQWDFPTEASLVDLFEKQVAEHADAIALELNDQIWTYRKLNFKANQLARFLRSQGLGEGDVIGIMLDRSPMMIQSILAALKIGATYLPLDADQPERRIRHVVEESKLAYLLYTQNWGEPYRAMVTGIAVEEVPLHDFEGDNLAQKIDPLKTAYILYTSGSTGQPKGVQIAHRSVVNYISYQSAYFEIGTEENILQFSPYYFDASVEQIWLALSTGARLVLVDKATLSDMDAFVAYLETKAITHLHATPSFLESIPVRANLNLRRVISGGETCKASLVEHFGSEVDFYNEYGPTEATISAIEGLVKPDLIRNGKVLLGKPLGNTQIYILNEQLEPQGIGVAGELYIAGEGLAQGYLNQPDLTAERFISHPTDPNLLLYRSGDLACWHADGNVEFLGRIDDQVKLRGYRIELGEIENQLAKHPAVNEAAVNLWDHAGGQYLVAYYVGETLTEMDLRTHLSARIPEYMMPTFWVPLEELPLTRNGKLDRRALPAPALETMAVLTTPSNALEAELQGLWSEVLNRPVEEIGVEHNFFELGGHSLKAIRLVSRIKQKIRVELPLVDLFHHNTIRSLALSLRLENTSPVSSDQALCRLLKRGATTDPHLFFIHDGSGDIHGYLPLVAGIEGFNCWGLRSPGFGKIAPQNMPLVEMARQYREALQAIQSTGPYQLVGWSTGGLLCYEVARQLLAVGESIEQVIMIDTAFPNREALGAPNFSLATEQALVAEVFSTESFGSRENQPLEDWWKEVIQHCLDQGLEAKQIHQQLPTRWKQLLPAPQDLDILSLLGAINVIRSLRWAVENYTSQAILPINLLYLKAKDSSTQPENSLAFFSGTKRVEVLSGDHFNLLQAPRVQTLIAALQGGLK